MKDDNSAGLYVNIDVKLRKRLRRMAADKDTSVKKLVVYALMQLVRAHETGEEIKLHVEG